MRRNLDGYGLMSGILVLDLFWGVDWGGICLHFGFVGVGGSLGLE